MAKYGDMSEVNDVPYTPEDIRYTLKDDCIYAISLGKIGNTVTLQKGFEHIYPNEIVSIGLLGDTGADGEVRPLRWKREGKTLTVITEGAKIRSDCNVLKIRRQKAY
jgi:alpha-L-fucosidase